MTTTGSPCRQANPSLSCPVPATSSPPHNVDRACACWRVEAPCKLAQRIVQRGNTLCSGATHSSWPHALTRGPTQQTLAVHIHSSTAAARHMAAHMHNCVPVQRRPHHSNQTPGLLLDGAAQPPTKTHHNRARCHKSAPAEHDTNTQNRRCCGISPSPWLHMGQQGCSQIARFVL